MVKRAIFLLLIISPCSVAQDIPRDTSYTFLSTYQKLVKSYPDVELVYAVLPENIKADEEIIYRRLENRQLSMNIYYPLQDTAGGYPAVLLIHGGGWRSGDKKLQIPMAQQLAAAGYVTAVAEYRLSLEAQYPAGVHDLKAALRWLRAHAERYNIDKKRIAIYGASAGGQLAALIGTTNENKKLEGEGGYPEVSSAVQAIIDVDGVLAFRHPESKEGTMAAEWLGGTYEEASQNWDEASALTHVGKDTPPILFIASSHPRFHAGKSDMIKVLEENEIYYESYYIPGSPHAFWLLKPWFESTLEYTVKFLDKVFKQD